MAIYRALMSIQFTAEVTALSAAEAQTKAESELSNAENALAELGFDIDDSEFEDDLEIVDG